MSSEQYNQYLRSEEWRKKSYKRMEIDNFRCVMCGCMGTHDNPLQTHHLSYKNLGQENVYRDILTLCKSCHKATHRMMSRVTGYNRDGSERHGWSESTRDFSSHVLQLTGETGDNMAIYGDD